MAQNRKSDLDPTQSSDSDSEEEEEAEAAAAAEASSEEDSESESEQPNPNPSPPPPHQITKKPSAPKKPDSSPSSSSSESESESDTATLKPHKPDRNIKPTSSRPMKDNNNHPPTKPTKRPRSKPTPPPPEKLSDVKRPADTEPLNESKRSKTLRFTDESKKHLFQRLWSEDDEMVILKGMIDYYAKKGTDPVADMDAFHEFIKKSLHVVDVSNTQLLNKVRRLKKKYENNAGKGKKGKERNFSKTHEKKAYELSKKIWGGGGLNNSASVVDKSSKINGTTVKKQRSSSNVKIEMKKADEAVLTPNGSNDVEKITVGNDVGWPVGLGQMGVSNGEWGFEEEMIKGGLELIKGMKKAELEEKWRKLNEETMELFLKRNELICEQTRLVLDVLKPGS